MGHDDQMQYDEENDTRARGRNTLTWVLLVGTLLAFIAGPTMVILFFGLLPSLVAYIIDRSTGKSATFCVAGMNIIGVFPYIITLWSTDNTFSEALAISTDIFSMLVMYASASFGWVIFLGLPTLISSFVLIMQQRKVAQLRGVQKDLIEEWSADVADLVEKEHSADQAAHMQKGASV